MSSDRKQIVFSNFYAGMSDDSFLGSDGTFQDGGNIEIRRNPRYIRLSPALNALYNTAGNLCNCIINSTEYIPQYKSTPSSNFAFNGTPYVYFLCYNAIYVQNIQTGTITNPFNCASGDISIGGSGTIYQNTSFLGGAIYILSISGTPTPVLFFTGKETHSSVTSIRLYYIPLANATAGSSNAWASNIFEFSSGTPGTGLTVDITAQNGQVKSAVPNVGGTGYVNGQLIQLLNAGDKTAILEVTSVSSGVVTSLGVYTPGNYYVNQTALSTVGVNVNSPLTTTANVQNNPFSITSTPFLNVENFSLVIGCGTQFFGLTQAGDLHIVSTLVANENITAFTYFQDLLKVYTNIGGINGKCHQYKSGTLVMISQIPTYTFDWDGLPIWSACNIGPNDYVLCGPNTNSYIGGTGNYVSLWQTNGYQRTKLHQGASEMGNTKFQFSSNPYGLQTINGIVYIQSLNGIYSYGQEMAEFPVSIMPDVIYGSAPGAITIPGPLAKGGTDGKTLLSGTYYNGSISEIYSLPLTGTPTSYSSTGYYISRIQTGGFISSLENLQEIWFGYYLPGTSTTTGSITISFVLPDGTVCNMLPNLSGSTTIGIGGDVSSSQIVFNKYARYKITSSVISASIEASGFSKYFNAIEMKVTITAASVSTTNDTSPKFFDAILFYDSNIQA